MLRHALFLYVQDLIEGRRENRVASFILRCLSAPYALAVLCRNWLYDEGYLEIVKVPAVVVSIGNIVAGGTGKTPLVHLLAKQFPKRAAILTRGYGSGDEAKLLQERLPDAKVYVDRDRVRSAKKAIEEGYRLLILDDGLQYRRLFRDFECILLNGEDPFGKGRYLPSGFLRDIPRRLDRPHILFSHPPARSFPHAIGLQITPIDPPLLKNLPVAIFSGIAHPERFKKTVEKEGAHIVATLPLADHEPLSFRALTRFASRANSLGAKAILCTEKDFVKLPPHASFPLPIRCIRVKMEVVSNSERWRNLIEEIEQKLDNYRPYGTGSKTT